MINKITDLNVVENKVDWNGISRDQRLSEPFIREFQDKVNWFGISWHQRLSEPFIREFKDKVNWRIISRDQRLSEDFIREYQDQVHWQGISEYQRLSEPFIREYQDHVDWEYISWYQRLSEPFIREFKDWVDWNEISREQRLSEDFIREFQDRVDWDGIGGYQWLSEEFVGEMGLSVSSGSWMRLGDEEKLVEIEGSGRYVVEDGWVYGWKSVREDMRSVYDPRVEYQVGEVVEDWRCDADCLHENSFGLSLWDKDGALDYHSTGILLKVRAKLSWIKAMVHDSHKLRTIKLEILSIN